MADDIFCDYILYSNKMDSHIRDIGRRVGHLAGRAAGAQGMTGTRSRTLTPDHGSVIQDYSGPGVSAGGPQRNASNIIKGATGVARDFASGSAHLSQLATNPIAGARGLVGDAISGAKHGLQAVKGVLPFLPIN
jgi:hypothetical protein